MGWMTHHAILVTSWNSGAIDEARQSAVDIFGQAPVSSVLGPFLNGFRSFFVAPDGSKEGWSESDEGDARREKFVGWVRDQAHDDGSSPLAWAEIQYGDDDGDARVVRRSDADMRSRWESQP